VNPSPGSPTYLRVDPALRMSVVHVLAHRSIEWPPNKGNLSFIEMPLTLMEDLGKFDVAKRIDRRGTKVVDGRTVEEVLVRGNADNASVLLDLDAERGVPLSMIDYAPNSSTPVMRFEYSYDAERVKQAIVKLTSGGEGAVPIDLAKDRPRFRREFISSPLSTTSTGRDSLRVYRVEQDPEGDVFVLYSCKGYHADDQMQQRWLQLRDDRGLQWLTNQIDMFETKLTPNGEGLKAQIFFHPAFGRSTKLARLSIRLNEWEYLSVEEPSTPRTKQVSLGDFAPQPVACVPDWYFYAFGVDDEAWVGAMAQKLRFQYALKEKDYSTAVQIGRPFDTAFPEMMGGLFFEQADLDKGLAEAYRHLGDAESAEQFARKAAKLSAR